MQSSADIPVSYVIRSTELRNNSIGSEYSMGGGMFFQSAGPGRYVMENLTCIENEVSSLGIA